MCFVLCDVAVPSFTVDDAWSLEVEIEKVDFTRRFGKLHESVNLEIIFQRRRAYIQSLPPILVP